MIVYVESNFVLEIALEQEQSSSAEAIMALAERHALEIAFPGFALSEPFATITQRGRDGVRLGSQISDKVRQLQRSLFHQRAVASLGTVPSILRDIARTETQRLQDTVSRLLDAGTYIKLDGAIYRAAVAYQSRYGLSPQDSIIYAVVVSDLRSRTMAEPKSFISRNWKDFRDPDILTELRSFGCIYAESFAEGLVIIQSQP